MKLAMCTTFRSKMLFFFVFSFFFFFRISSETIIEFSEVTFSKLERFDILLSNSCSTSFTVNECKRNLFTQKPTSVEEIKATRVALVQHAKRASLQRRL